MHNYDFSTLSDYDFEIIVGDLLQAENDFTLEHFAKGRDSGIDLRYAGVNENPEIIVQCKHYLRSGKSKLLSSIRTEYEKVKQLKPKRYILTTSVSLTPKLKSSIQAILGPFCLSTGDILGVDELNNLLGKHPSIERKHFKLWLSSTAILERILHANIISESNSEISRVNSRISKYVVCGLFPKALEILKSSNVCIVSGPPGVGKTTLAEIVLSHYLRDDYECIKIPRDILDARQHFMPERRQIFYYDDFLGKTNLLETMGKNEDDRIIRFIHDVQLSPNTKFILTTREYILRQAQNSLEAFQHSNLGLYKVVLEIGNYTKYEKAKILYNHIYFSGLPKKLRLKVAVDANYEKIIGHRNYSPRIIEYMTEVCNLSDFDKENYLNVFITNLENPERIWRTAFHKHLSYGARELILLLSSLPQPIFSNDLRVAYQEYIQFRSRKYNREISPYDFNDTLRELEGSFLKTAKTSTDLIVRFHNPSIDDFLEALLKENIEDISDLLDSSVYLDQVLELQELLKNIKLFNHSDFERKIGQKFLALMSKKRVNIIQLVSNSSPQEKWIYHSPTIEFSILRYVRLLSKDESGQSFTEYIEVHREYLKKKSVNSLILAMIVTEVEKSWPKEIAELRNFHSELYEKMLSTAIASHDIDDYKGLGRFLEDHPEVDRPRFEELQVAAGQIVSSELEEIIQENPPLSKVEEALEKCSYISEALNLDLNVEIDMARQSTREPDNDADDVEFESESEPDVDDVDLEIYRMFSTIEE